MPQTPAPTRANVRQSATWRISDTNLSPPCQLTTHAADSMLFLSKSRLFGFLPTKFPEYPRQRLPCGGGDEAIAGGRNSDSDFRPGQEPEAGELGHRRRAGGAQSQA